MPLWWYIRPNVDFGVCHSGTFSSLSCSFPSKMSRSYLTCAHVIACCVILSYAQYLPPLPPRGLGLGPINTTVDTLDSADTVQSDLWLIARDDPVPVQLNRNWNPDVGMPGVQHVAAFHRGDLNPNSDDRSLQQNLEAYFQDPRHPSYNVNSNPLRRTGEDNLNIYSPEAVLVELPRDLTTGLWERPRPELMNQMTSSARRVDSTKEQSVIQGDNGTSRPEFVPIRDATTRLPITDLVAEKDHASNVGTLYNLPYDAIFVPSHNTASNISSNDGSSISSRQDIWLPTQGRVNSGSLPVVNDNGGRLLYDLSFDNVPVLREQEPDVALTLTKDDIEILEKLGILSSLVSESGEQGLRDSLSGSGGSHREYESSPILIDNVGQSYTLIPEGQLTNLSDVVFFEVPEFVTSDYHGNIPGSDDNKEPARLEPYTVVGPSDKSESYQNSTNLTDVHEYNATSLSHSQIHEILHLLGLTSPEFLNATLVPLNASLEQTLETPELNDKIHPANGTSDSKDPKSTNTDTTAPTADTSSNSTNSSTSISSRSFETATSERIEKVSSKPGLVSSGRIQPRLLDRLPSERENEIRELMSRRVSEQKMEILRKLNLKPAPYVFAYRQNDGNGTFQHRNETSDASGVVQGTYGYRDPFGLYRSVNYIADSNGFHAVVRTNEPGTISHNPADALFMSEIPPQEAIEQMMAYAKVRSQVP